MISSLFSLSKDMAANDGEGGEDLGEEFCGECNVRRKVVSSINLGNDRKLKRLACGHEMTQIIKQATERVSIKEKRKALPFKVRDPVEEIKRAAKGNDPDCFKIVAYSCAVFEYYGAQLLVWHERKYGIPLSKRPEKMLLSEIINELGSTNRKIIDQPTKDKLDKIRVIRNQFVHKEYSLKFPSTVGARVISYLPDIYKCLSDLKGKYEKWVK